MNTSNLSAVHWVFSWLNEYSWICEIVNSIHARSSSIALNWGSSCARLGEWSGWSKSNTLFNSELGLSRSPSLKRMLQLNRLEDVEVTLTVPLGYEHGEYLSLGHLAQGPSRLQLVCRPQGQGQSCFLSKIHCSVCIIINVINFIPGIEGIWPFWFEISVYHAVLGSCALPKHAGLHDCTKSVLEWLFLPVVLDRTSDKYTALSLLTLNDARDENEHVVSCDKWLISTNQ